MSGLQSFKEKIQNWSFSKTDRIAPFVLSLLILLLCWTLASLFWWLIAPPQAIQAEQVNLGSQQAAVPNISSFALFQEIGTTSQAADANVVMQLQGVVVASPSQNSSAVIKVNDVAERYQVGDSLNNTGYQLAEVYWDKVILRQNNGQTKILQFSTIENLYQPMGTEAASANSNTSPTAQNSSSNTSNNTANNNSTGMTNSQRALGQAIDQIQENREQYLKTMGVNTSGGQGYEVTDQTPAVVKNKLGLKSGDRILSLNGQTVGQGQTEAQLLEQAKREGKVRIEVKRGDQVMTFQQDL